MTVFENYKVMDNKYFVTYEQAKRLYELGFNEKCAKKYGLKDMGFGGYHKIAGSERYQCEFTDYSEGYLYDCEHIGEDDNFVNAPYIFQAIDFIYTKYKIWLSVHYVPAFNSFKFCVSGEDMSEYNKCLYESAFEAYINGLDVILYKMCV